MALIINLPAASGGVDANLILYRGTAPTLRFTMTANGSVAGWTTRFSMRMKSDAADPLTVDKAGSINNAGSGSTPGIFDVALTKAELLAVLVRFYLYSFERVDSGSEDILTIGKADVRYDVRNPKA